MGLQMGHATSLPWRWAAGVGAALGALVLVSTAVFGAGSAPRLPAAPTVGQDFQDVAPTDPFYPYLHNLAAAGVVGGYGCGGAGEPCVPPANLPYYRPGNAVTRLQMSKFIDLGRRNIADAVGTSLVLSSTFIPLNVKSNGSVDAIAAGCLTAGNGCTALSGFGQPGNYGANLFGGRGTITESTDNGYPALDAHATGANAYGVSMQAGYRGGYAKSTATNEISMYVDTAGGPFQGTAGLYVYGAISGQGNLYIAGSKAGYVVDIMQNVDSAPLAPGDVVVIAGSSAPVLGQIPVVTVKKATSAYDTGVAGVVDQVMYVPDAATKAAYDAQEAAMRAAQAGRAAAQAAAAGSGSKPAEVAVSLATISDEQGMLHALPDATSVAPGGYLTVVTLGSYKAVQVDASFGPIQAGDLLTSSPHAGYAMKVRDKLAAMGAVIGKALAGLATGTGTVPVLVTLK